MRADQHTNVGIDANEIATASVSVLSRLTCPVRFVLQDELEQGSSGRSGVPKVRRPARRHRLGVVQW